MPASKTLRGGEDARKSVRRRFGLLLLRPALLHQAALASEG